MGNPNHDQRGRFSSGSSGAAATGNHMAVSPSTATRNVPGHGTVARSKPIARHAGEPSVGTERPRLSEAARANIIRGKGIDQRHYPIETDRTVANKTGLIGTRVAPGKLDPRLSTLVSGGDKPRVRVKVR